MLPAEHGIAMNEQSIPILVRPAEDRDAEAVRRLGEAAFAANRSTYRPKPSTVAALTVSVPTLQRLVAEHAGELVGSVRHGVSGDVLRVIGLAVSPPWHRRGVARSLLQALADIGRQRGRRALALYTIVQTGNVPVFERLGFRTVSEGPDEHSISVTGDLLTEAYMERSVP